MVFVPFTVVNHHKKSVTVGAGLLSNESIESYCWLLRAFLKAHGKQPILVLTDQDPAIKQAIQIVFPESKHRLCMWHIMKKLKFKISADLSTNKDFRRRFSKLVWDLSVKPEDFEIQWMELIKEYKLEEIRWFQDMFDLRMSWIPGYFNNISMCGLMKTTSRSESMNSFFNTYSQSGNLLLNFMMNYDTAIQKQRNTQQEDDRATKNAVYEPKTPREIEVHAAKVFTSTVFFEVQYEIAMGCFYCNYALVGNENGWEVYTIQHLSKRSDFKKDFRVEINVEEKEVNCNCERFNRTGILCRHAFTVLMKCGIKEIPERYIANRWRKDVLSSRYRFKLCDSGDRESVKLVNEAYYFFEAHLDSVRKNKQKLVLFVDEQRKRFKAADSGNTYGVVKEKTNAATVSKLMGVVIPETVEINVPEVQRNKGCGTNKRIPSASEKEPVEHRTCSICKTKAPHNARTCPMKDAAAKD